MANLYEKINIIKESIKEAYKPLPDYIATGLKVDEIRDYQKEAFRNFITYFENDGMRRKPSKTLFWMATGSGKTLIMAGLMLYLYEKGYRDFMFFVNNTNIIDKTIKNFTDSANSKYLFRDSISIKGEQVKIRKVETFDESDPDSINILFTSIQGLHTDMSITKENRMCIDTFENRRVVLIADEAHHNLAATKKGKKKAVRLEDPSWENTVNLVFNCNPNNVLLEFTATFDEYDANIVNEYADKIIYNYDLKHFRNDKYSKEIDVVRTDLEVMDKCILAMVFSQYRLKMFQDNHINVKPCILFKAHQTIKECEDNIEQFINLVKNLTGKDIKRVLESIDDDKVKPVIKYFSDKKISYDSLALELQEAFNEEHIISANDDKVEDNQLILNSLEDEDNPYRAIFEVRKLDEGWDVLNLFDIVRMYTSREGGETKVAPATMSEAQLIGRGARYYPFKLKSDDPLYKRKFDEDLDNPLRMCESLLYHCQTDSKYLSELRKALIQTGAIDEKKNECEYIIKDSFKENKIWKKGFVFVNKRLEKSIESIDGIDEKVRCKDYQLTTDTGTFGINVAFDDENSTTLNTQDIKSKGYKIADLANKYYHLVRKALMQYPNLSFNILKCKYPNLESTREFITSDKYMGGISFTINSKFEEPPIEVIYKGLMKVADKLSNHIETIGVRYEGSTTFKPLFINKVFSDKKVEYSTVVSNGRGEPQKDSSDIRMKIDLSKEDWFAYEENYGTSEEKLFVKYFSKKVEEFKKKYDNVYLIRNERQLAIYSFDDGDRFEPDYILFLQKKNAKDAYDQLQVFIEPKGDQLLKTDEWKEKFLLQLKEEDKRRCEISSNLSEDNQYNIWGLHFYNDNRNQLEKDFDKDIDELVK